MSSDGLSRIRWEYLFLFSLPYLLFLFFFITSSSIIIFFCNGNKADRIGIKSGQCKGVSTLPFPFPITTTIIIIIIITRAFTSKQQQHRSFG